MAVSIFKLHRIHRMNVPHHQHVDLCLLMLSCVPCLWFYADLPRLALENVCFIAFFARLLWQHCMTSMTLGQCCAVSAMTAALKS